MKREIKDHFSGIYAGKRVLITGDTGFKGSWLALWLHGLGAEVFGYSLPPRTPEDNYCRCGLDKVIRHRDGDVRDAEALSAFFKEVQPDIAFHLAAQAIVLESYDQPQYTFATNLMGVVNFFEAVRSTPSVKAAVNITSDKCYQNNEWLWGYRENDPMGGNDPYSASKGCSELITQSYLRSFFQHDGTCHIASGRAGNVIGGGDWAPYRIIPDFFRAMRAGVALEIRNPDAVRPWQHVLEPLSGYLLLGAKLFSDGAGFSGGWNFGPVESNTCTVRQLTDRLISHIRKVKGGSVQIVTPDKEKKHEANLLKLDISKAMALLKWHPVLTFGETAEFTATGYLDELAEGKDVLACRIGQIEKYVALAEERGLEWAGPASPIGEVD